MRMQFRWVAAFAVAAISGASAQTYRDSNGTIVPGVAPLVNCTPSGICAGPASAANPMPVSVVTAGAPAGSTGADFSANKPTLPNVGANFGASGPYANYVLIASISANGGRIAVDIENTSGAQIAVLLDDGSAAGGAAPTNSTIFALGGGAGTGAQGGSWFSEREKGRVQIFAPSSTAQVAVRQN